MIKQETIYDKTTYKIIDYKEYLNGQLIVHNQIKTNGNSIHKTYYDGIEEIEEYDNLDRIVIEKIPNNKIYFKYTNEIRIPYKNINNQYIEAYYQILYVPSYVGNNLTTSNKAQIRLILFKKLSDTHNLRIIKYLDKLP
jgi:hypothetical protein